MLIRSQNKEVITKLKNEVSISKHKDTEEFMIGVYGGEGMFVLGRYSTKEKAIKVMDMIATKYENLPPNCNAVLQMPLDEEVTDASTEANEQEK